MNLTATFVLLLEPFRPVFTTPSFLIFTDVLTGWALSPRHRFVTELIFSSGSLEKGHFSRYHYFFAYGVWVLDRVFEVLAIVLVCTLVPQGTVILAVDDTLCLKRGLTLYGAGMHHDPLISSRKKKLTRWGHDWVVICLLLVHPFWAPTKVFALPIGVRLYKNRQGVTKAQRGKKPRGKKKKRPESSDPPGTGRGADSVGSQLVSHTPTDAHRRQPLRRQERARRVAGQRGLDQPRPPQRSTLQAGTP